MDARVSLQNIADHCGLSVSTVSLALRDVGKVNAKTRRKVQAVAQRLGYQPNPLLASLASGHFRGSQGGGALPLAYIQMRTAPSENTTRYERQVQAQAQVRASQLGYFLDAVPLEQAMQPGFSRMIYNRGYQGVILAPVEECPLPSLDWERFTIVVMDDLQERVPFHSVTPNHFDGVWTIWQELRHLGYRRIGWALAGHEPPIVDDILRQAGMRTVLEQTPQSERIPDLSGLGFSDSPKALLSWTKKYRPEAVVGFHCGYYYALREGGYRIPEDLGYASLHCNATEGESEFAISGMFDMRAEVLKTAVEVMDREIRLGHRGMPERPLKLMVTPRWHLGETVIPR